MSTLRERAAARNGGEVATTPKDELPSLVAKMEGAFAAAAPKGIEAVQLVRDAQTCLRTIRKLDECEPQSVLGALMTAAQLGLRPGVLGHCWPLPFWDNYSKRMRAQFVLGYMGMVELAYRSPEVVSTVGRVVHENDPVWEVNLGTSDEIRHTPLMTGDPGDPIAYYTVIKTVKNGHVFQWMSLADVLAHRERHAPRNKAKQITGPWAQPVGSSEFDAMAMKTTMRRLFRWVPKSTALAQAIEVDGAVRVDVTPTIPAIEASVHVDPGTPTDEQPPTDEHDPTVEPGFGSDGAQ